MNWRVLFFLSACLLGASLYFRDQKGFREQQENTLGSEQLSVAPPSKTITGPKKSQRNEKKTRKVRVSSTLTAPTAPTAQGDPQPFQLPINDPKHYALVDNEGSLYPTNLTVDEEYVVAYGDVIVGNSRDIDDIKNGDETVKVPKPQPWPNGELPYRVDENLTDAQKQAIVRIGEVLEQENVIKMRPFELGKDKAYVHFKKGSNHCYAQVGYTGGVTQVALNTRCGENEIFHEVFHVLGFFHEQNRYDRDDFVKILWENIDEKHWPQFEKFPVESLPDAFQNPSLTPFTFDTFMLYRSTAFSNNSDYSIVNVYGEPFREYTRPSQEDFRRARLLYGK